MAPKMTITEDSRTVIMKFSGLDIQMSLLRNKVPGYTVKQSTHVDNNCVFQEFDLSPISDSDKTLNYRNIIQNKNTNKLKSQVD